MRALVCLVALLLLSGGSSLVATGFDAGLTTMGVLLLVTAAGVWRAMRGAQD